MTTSAGGQMAGYLWQAFEACRRCLTSPPDSVIKIEVEDDLSIARTDGEIDSCEQLKHSENIQGISEDSPLWWQAIDAWIRGPAPNTATLRLLTTSDLQPGSLLASCYQPTSAAPWDKLLDAMNTRAVNAPNTQLEKKGVYGRWLNLQGERRALLMRIQISSSQGGLEASSDLLEQALMNRSVPPAIVARVRESFVGSFMARLTNTLDSGGFEVTIREMNADFLEAYARNAAPGVYEFSELNFTDTDIEALKTKHHQHLIPQLAAINKNQPGIVARAIENWFRARTHRQEFMDRSAHEIKDLLAHDKDLVQFNQTLHEEHAATNDLNEARQIGRAVHASCMKYQAKLGRTDPPLDFLQGSYHELSNILRVKWNPLYTEDE